MGKPRTFRWAAAVFGSGLLSLVLLACGDSGNREESPPCCPVTSEDDALPPVRIKEQDLLPILMTAPESQARALSDGVLTFAEYEAAVLAMATCIRDSPLGIEFATIDATGNLVRMPGPWLDRRGRYQYSFFYPGSVPESEEKIASCRSEFLTAIENFWIVQVAPSEHELAAARRALGECLRAYGEEVPKEPSERDFDRFRMQPTTQFLRCSATVAEEYALPGFSG